MGIEPKPVKYNGRICCDCNQSFSEISSIGPSNICQPCADIRLVDIFDHYHQFPVPGDRVSCGLRKDLPKKQRRHEFVSLGIDTRHYGAFGEFMDMEVLACLDCGRDKVKKVNSDS